MSVKISDLPESTDVYDGCCMPIVTNGETKKIYYSLLKEKLRQDLDIPAEINIDDALSKLSTNPVQNKIITIALENFELKINAAEQNANAAKLIAEAASEAATTIGAALNSCVKTVNGQEPDENGNVDVEGETVKYSEQTLTESEKKQARENIGANDFQLCLDFISYEELVNDLLSQTQYDDLKYHKGQVIRVNRMGRNDLWISYITGGYANYTYSTDQQFETDMQTISGGLQVGHYYLKQSVIQGGGSYDDTEIREEIKDISDYLGLAEPQLIDFGTIEQGGFDGQNKNTTNAQMLRTEVFEVEIGKPLVIQMTEGWKIAICQKDDLVFSQSETWSNTPLTGYQQFETFTPTKKYMRLKICHYDSTDTRINVTPSELGENVLFYDGEEQIKPLDELDNRITAIESEVFGSDETPTHIYKGNPWTDGKWKNATNSSNYSYVYEIEEGQKYDMYYSPDYGFEIFMSRKSLSTQPQNQESLDLITYNDKNVNMFENDKDTVEVNGCTINRYTITDFVFPSECKSVIIVKRISATNYNGIRLYKRKGAKGIYRHNSNANKKVAVLGDSISQNKRSEKGKEYVRNLLGCKVTTYGVGGSGWSKDAYLSSTWSNNVSGVYQAEEMAKEDTPVYDIYCLTATLNDPITHNKPIGDFNYCKPYLKNADGTPDLTDPNLNTMLGGLNFAIQRIYDKNPNAKIVIGNMTKCFLNTSKSGFDVKAGYDPFDTSTNSHGHTYYEYVQAIRKLGEVWGTPVVDVYGEAGFNEFNYTQLLVDEYHPNEKGYDSIWKLWFDKIANL